MTDCEHPAFDTVVGIERTELGHLATIEIYCRECRQPFRFVGLQTGLDHREPTCSADGQAARLPILPAHNSGATLRCPECEHLLVGPQVDRPVAVVAIDCGPEHVVRYADGVALAVGPYGVRSLDDDDGTT